MPHPHAVRDHKVLRVFGRILHDPNLFHLNRTSAARGCAIGIFWALIPMPFQMIPAAICAILFRGNLVLSVALVWLTNPLTIPPIFYATYHFGRWLLNRPPREIAFEFTWDSLWEHADEIWRSLYFGSFVAGVLLGTLTYLAIRLFWRCQVTWRWYRRRPQIQA